MTILDRYVLKAIFLATLIAGFAITAISLVMLFVQELEGLRDAGYGLGVAFQTILLQLPQGVYDLFPVMVLLGALMGLGNMAAGSELVVMRGAGISIWRLAWSVLQAGLVFAILCFCLGEWLVPLGQAQLHQLHAENVTEASASVAADEEAPGGLWFRDGKVMVHVKDPVSPQRLNDLRMYHFDRVIHDATSDGSISKTGKRLTMLRTARYAEFNNGQWHLYDATSSRFSEQGVELVRLDKVIWQTRLSPEVFDVGQSKPDDLSTLDLIDYVVFLQSNDQDAGDYAMTLWRKLAAPITVIAMALLAIPFVSGSLRSTGAGQRLFVGVLVGVSFFLVNLISTSTGRVYGFSPFVAAWLPTLVLLALALYWLFRLNRPVRRNPAVTV